jgi:hypothetical protein
MGAATGIVPGRPIPGRGGATANVHVSLGRSEIRRPTTGPVKGEVQA